MVLVKNWQFFHIFILAKKWKENVLEDILEWKNTFVDNRKKIVNKIEKLAFF